MKSLLKKVFLKWGIFKKYFIESEWILLSCHSLADGSRKGTTLVSIQCSRSTAMGTGIDVTPLIQFVTPWQSKYR